jgi:hypothetical protein
MAKATSPYASHNYVVSLEGPHGPEGYWAVSPTRPGSRGMLKKLLA